MPVAMTGKDAGNGDMLAEPEGSHGRALDGTPLPAFDRPVRTPLGHAPLRRPGSVRRTMSLDVTWPHGFAGHSYIAGRGRDIRTPSAGQAPVLLREDRLDAEADHRTLITVASTPPRIALAELAGARAGGYLRDECAAGSPLHLMLDDLAGVTLVSRWAWSQWDQGFAAAPTQEARDKIADRMTGVCMGFRPGSSAIADQRAPSMEQNVTAVGPLAHPDDPEGWHALAEYGEVQFRRARRIDAWRQGEEIHIDAGFQDSANTPGGGARVAIHEYRLHATADGATGALTAIDATPGTLPYRECPAAPVNLPSLVGTPLAELRQTVLERLRRTDGCTHLNDLVRSLAEVPVLLRAGEAGS